MVNIAINGFGRIGRSVLRACLEKKVNVVVINDVHGPKNAAYLFKYDSVYGKFPEKVDVFGNYIHIGGKKIRVISQREIEKLPWKKLKIDIVVESTGVFRNREDAMKHIDSGAKKVLVTAPLKDEPDITIVPGVNHNELKKSHQLVSVASCTTNCAAVLAKVLNDSFGIKWALLTTVHSYTASQSLTDSNNERDPRRGRAAAVNIIPTSTGAASSIEEAIPELKGRINGFSLRVPVLDGSVVDFVAELEKKFDVDKVNKAFKNSVKKDMKKILEFSEEDIVSSDIIGNSHSAIVDSKMTQKEGNLVKVLAWYDNEYGYSNRVADVIKMMGRR